MEKISVSNKHIMIILTIILIFSFYLINIMLRKDNHKNCNSFINNIKNASEQYFNDKKNIIVNNSLNITVNDLINNKYLEKNIKDPFNGNQLDPEKIFIKIKLDDNYNVENITIFSGNEEIDCNNEYTFKYSKILSSESSDDNEKNSSSIPSSSLSSKNSASKNSSSKASSSKYINSKSSLSSNKKIILIDKSGDYCAEEIEYFYSDNKYKYYFTCIKSQNMYVLIDGREYGLVYALENKIVTISELEDNGYHFLKEKLNVYDR